MHTTALTVIAIVTTLSYFPGTSSGYIADDYPNIVDNPSVSAPASLENAWGASVSSDSGLLKRPISMLSFFLVDKIPGADSRNQLAVNIAIHTFNALLAYVLLVSLLGATLDPKESTSASVVIPALTGTLIWSTCSSHVFTTLYIVQRMTLLSGSFCLAAVILVIHTRKKRGLSAYCWFLAIGLLVALSTLSKESGILTIPLAVIALGISEPNKTRIPKRHRGTTVAAAGLVTITFIAFLANSDWLEANYAVRTFTLPERFTAQLNLLTIYPLSAFPTSPFYGLFFWDSKPVYDLLHNWKGAFVFPAALITALIAARISKSKTTLLLGGLAWYTYGHALESTLYPLEIAWQHRNYIPFLGLFAFVPAVVLLKLQRANKNWLPYALSFTIISSSAFACFSLSALWADKLIYFTIAATQHVSSYRTNYTAAKLHTKYGNPEFGLDGKSFLQKTLELKDGEEALFLQLSLDLIRSSRLDAGKLEILCTRFRANPKVPLAIYSKLMKNELMLDYLSQETHYTPPKLTECILSNPNNTAYSRALIYQILAGVIIRDGDYPEGVALINASMEISGENPHVASQAALSFAELQLCEEARTALSLSKDNDQLRRHVSSRQEAKATINRKCKKEGAM